ncbi:MAG: hypothetical protein SFT91_01920 [Rickettsiaceae bacterium]|nr:hypothetical protein [Rickettsiaceae bacterium]
MSHILPTLKKHLLRVVLNIFFAAVFLGLQSCANMPRYQGMPKYSPETFKSSNKAILFFEALEERYDKQILPFDLGLNSNYSRGYNQSFTPLSFTLKSYYSGKEYNINNYSSMIILDPGIYYINRINLASLSDGAGTLKRWLPGPGLKKVGNEELFFGTILYGAFELKVGEVVTCGLLVVKEKDNLFDLRVVRNIDRLKAQLSKSKTPELIDQLQEKHIYKHGSFILKAKGKVTLIDSSIIAQYRNKVNMEIAQKIKEAQQK